MFFFFVIPVPAGFFFNPAGTGTPDFFQNLAGTSGRNRILTI